MSELLSERARAYLDALEADRQAALALSEQKAEEAKLLQARLEGFQAAVKMLGGNSAVANTECNPKEPARRRRTRRRIPELIVRELSFSGQAMTVRQIAKAIDYNLEGTETALNRMEKDGQVLRDKGGGWAIAMTALDHGNGSAARTGNGKFPAPAHSE
jgi:hypothetical protein